MAVFESEAQALRCTQCGATLPAALPEVASVACPSCGSVNRVAGELLDALHGHRRDVARERDQAARAERASVGSDVTRSFGGGWAALFVSTWLLAGVIAMPGTTSARALAMAVFLAPFGLFAGSVRTRQRRFAAAAAASRAREQALLVHCPTCGGQSEFRAGEPVRACRYCSGALAADDAARVELLARARASTQHQEHRARVASWRLAARQHREPRTDLVPYFVIGGLGSLWVIGTLIVDVRWLLAATQMGVGELLALNGVSIAVVLGVGVPLWIRQRRLQRWFAAVERLAADGSSSREVEAFAEWLSAHWLGAFDPRSICAGLGYAFVASAGPPWWAVSIAPQSSAPGSIERHLRVLLPGQPGSMLDAWAQRLQPLGFRCRVDEGGLVATLEQMPLDAIFAEPERLDQLLAVLKEGRA